MFWDLASLGVLGSEIPENYNHNVNTLRDVCVIKGSPLGLDDNEMIYKLEEWNGT